VIPKQYSAEVQAIGDSIANLTLAEAVQLSDYLESAHGIKKGGTTVEIVPPVPDVQPQVPVQTEFDVALDGLADPSKKIAVIKTVREMTGLGLAEAKGFVEAAPKVIKEKLSRGDADEIAARLTASGAKVTVK
jgi:large subunit ribosomal protein L7/L12